MSKIPSPHFQMESWAIIFPISCLINFGIVHIWPISKVLIREFGLQFSFFSSQRELHSIGNIDSFRWGTNLCILLSRPSVRLSVHPSAVHHILGTIHHLTHFWNTCVKWWYLHAFFFIFLKIWFFRLLGE